MKLYTVVLIPYFLLRRQYRLSVSALLWVFAFFVLAPLAYFGPAGFLEVTSNWIRSVAATSTAEFPFEFRAFHLSLHRVLLSFLTERGGGGVTNLFDLEARTVLMIARGLQLAWLLCIISYFVWEWKEPRYRSDYPSDLINVGILGVAVLILGPELQPHHGVAVLIPSMILAAVLFDSRQPTQLRWGAAVILSVGYIGLKLSQGKMYKGLGMNLCLVLFCLALLIVRASWGKASPATSREAEPAPALQ
jgi:hypothetical protein